jgi:hypothetical protein
MSSTTPTPERCCEKCDTPRTYDQCIANHTTPLPPSTSGVEDDCVISQLPYGSEKLAVRMTDVTLQIVSLPGCTHIFGAACVRSLRPLSALQRCPLCRTQWWKERRNTGNEPEEEARHEAAERVAQSFQTDYCTARYALYHEDEYANNHPPHGLAWFEGKYALTKYLCDIVATDEIQKRIRELQDKHAVTLENVTYDARDETCGVQGHGPFTFNNYHLGVSNMAYTIYQTLNSWRGRRLWLIYRDVLRKVLQNGESVKLESVLGEWMETFPDDEEDWVGLILQVLWVSILVEQEYGDGEFRVAVENNAV